MFMPKNSQNIELPQKNEVFSNFKKVNENSVKTLDQLITILRSMRAEDPITIEILRDGNSIVLDFQLDLRPSDI